jgi:hypothetical protein
VYEIHPGDLATVSNEHLRLDWIFNQIHAAESTVARTASVMGFTSLTFFANLLGIAMKHETSDALLRRMQSLRQPTSAMPFRCLDTTEMAALLLNVALPDRVLRVTAISSVKNFRVSIARHFPEVFAGDSRVMEDERRKRLWDMLIAGRTTALLCTVYFFSIFRYN